MMLACHKEVNNTGAIHRPSLRHLYNWILAENRSDKMSVLTLG